MELFEANRILRAVKAAAAADGFKLPAAAETDGLLMLLGKLDRDKYLGKLMEHCSPQPRASAATGRAIGLLALFRALLAVEKGLREAPSVTELTELHKDLYGTESCAGKLRTKEAQTNGNAHTDPKYIAGSLKSITAKMKDQVGAPKTAKEDFAVYLSHYMRELIILHPFETGSEFTVRIFIIMFCRAKGFALDYFRATPATIKSAETDAFAADDVTPLYTLFSHCLAYDYKTIATASPNPRADEKRRPPRKAPTPQKPIKKAKPTKRPVEQLSEDEIIMRAVHLQQKISKLNEQLTELMRPIEDKQSDK